MTKKPSDRTVRRATERAADKLAKNRERLAALEPGGSSDHPLEVSSSSLVEVRAKAMTCLRCAGALRLDDHAALNLGERRLRRVRLACVACGARREVFFKVGTTLAS
ncbi:MAG: hypothetical protein EOO75_11600 [Myxococcales bacterium]|nr:MAG: hypothetical protein EOO75_11600 [Myxococcales bacterium]